MHRVYRKPNQRLHSFTSDVVVNHIHRRQGPLLGIGVTTTWRYKCVSNLREGDADYIASGSTPFYARTMLMLPL